MLMVFYREHQVETQYLHHRYALEEVLSFNHSFSSLEEVVYTVVLLYIEVEEAFWELEVVVEEGDIWPHLRY
jgi:predicted DNA-binding ArsR family transcriptional regulator